MALRKKARSKRYNFTSNKVRLVRGGEEYFRILTELIRSARDTVHLQTYIYENDETGNMVADALIEAAQKNVAVYLLVDGYASQGLPTLFIQKLIDGGVHFRYFEPLLRSRHFYFGRRLHSKVIVVDSRCAMVGGVNITNRYNDLPGQPAWLDFALCAEGPVAIEVCRQCQNAWSGTRHRQVVSTCEPPAEGFDFSRDETSLVRVRRNDFVNNKLQISNSYLEMFRTAKSHITILSSYALPGNVFRKNLERALRRGVKVRMIITGESDVMLVKHAERYWYDWLMRNKIEIYEYTKNVLHGKLAVCDSEWMTIGSYNVNDLSAYASIEMNFDVHDHSFVAKVDKVLEKIMKEDCIAVSEEHHEARTPFQRLGWWMSYNIIRLLFSVTTFYYRKQK